LIFSQNTASEFIENKKIASAENRVEQAPLCHYIG